MAEESLKHQTKKGIYWTFFNQFAINGLNFVVGIVMARLLCPSDYGITALPAVFMAVASIFIESGFSTALVRKPELTEKDLSTAFIYSTAVGILCYVIIFLCAPFIADFYNEPVLVPLIRVTALSFLWSPLVTPQNTILKRNLDFKTPARIAIVTRIIGAAIGIFLAYRGYGLWALVITGVVSSFLTFIQTWIAVKWVPKARWSRDSFKYLWGFGNKMMASALLDTIYNNIVPVVVGKFFSTAELGVYNRANNYASLPSQQGTSVIQQVTFPVLSKIQDETEILSRSYRKMLKVSAFVIFPIMTLMSALAKPLVIVLVTEKWIDAVILLQILCFSVMWYPIHAINLNLLQVKGRSDSFLKLEVIKKIIGLAIMAATLPFGLIYFVASRIPTSLICLAINTHYTGKLINVGFITQMRDILPSLLLSLLVFVCVFGITFLIDNMIIQLIVGGIVGIAIYIGLAFILHFDEINDVKYMLHLHR